MEKFDAIVIGSGQAGTPLSKKLAKAGWKTALIEKRWIGGVCVNDGCTPTKTMIASARLAYQAASSKKLGIGIEDFSIDLAAIVNRKNEVVNKFRNGAQKGLEQTEDLELIFGEASFTADKTLEIAGNGTRRKVTAEHIFINTGTFTTIPPIDGIDKIPWLTSTEILDIKEIPAHLLIIGASYIGMEFGQMFKRFGSRVTMLEFAPQLLPMEDRDIAGCIEEILKEEGITFHTKTKTEKFTSAANQITVTAGIDGTVKDISCSHVLIAAGRTPQTKDLNLEKTGVDTDGKGYIKVNEKLETSRPGIYALGDVKGGPAFTHISYNDYIVVTKNLLKNGDVSVKGRLVPYCMFTDPQLGRIGITETEARKQGLNIEVATLPMEHVARAIETGDTRGMMKAVVDADTKQILGAAIIGTEGGEIMSVLQMAMQGGITYEQIRENIFAHPLYSESLNNLFMTLDK